LGTKTSQNKREATVSQFKHGLKQFCNAGFMRRMYSLLDPIYRVICGVNGRDTVEGGFVMILDPAREIELSYRQLNVVSVH
jgi:hypothetical protein